MPKNDNWSTPADLMKILDREFRFNLEVCAAKDNRALPHVSDYLGLDNERDALKHEWFAVGEDCTVAYCNPPYSLLPAFIKRAGDQDGPRRTRVLLIPAYTDTKAWQEDILIRAHEVRLLKGRLAFLLDGKKQTTARFPSAVVIYRPVKGLTGAMVHGWDWRSA